MHRHPPVASLALRRHPDNPWKGASFASDSARSCAAPLSVRVAPPIVYGAPTRDCEVRCPMNDMSDEQLLRARLDELRREHRDLDARIDSLHLDHLSDQLTLKRLKKRKLWLKDQIARVEDQLYPDIIA